MKKYVVKAKNWHCQMKKTVEANDREHAVQVAKEYFGSSMWLEGTKVISVTISKDK